MLLGTVPLRVGVQKDKIVTVYKPLRVRKPIQSAHE